MANVDVTRELQRAAKNIRDLTTALHSERQDRADDGRKAQARIKELEDQVANLIMERDEAQKASTQQAEAVSSGMSDVEAANKEAQAALHREFSS